MDVAKVSHSSPASASASCYSSLNWLSVRYKASCYGVPDGSVAIHPMSLSFAWIVSGFVQECEGIALRIDLDREYRFLSGFHTKLLKSGFFKCQFELLLCHPERSRADWIRSKFSWSPMMRKQWPSYMVMSPVMALGSIRAISCAKGMNRAGSCCSSSVGSLSDWMMNAFG